jgi:N-methylhydantoinase A
MGCVIADMRQDFVQTINAMVDGLDTSAMAAFMQTHVDQGMALLKASNTTFEARDLTFELDMAYLGQTHTVSVSLSISVSNGKVKAPTQEEIGTAFDSTYQATYGRLLKNGVRRVMNLRTAVIGRRPKFDLSTLAPAKGKPESTHKGTRQVHFGNKWHDTAIYNRLDLPVGAIIAGPAILEQPDTTVLIEPNLIGTVDDYGNTIITAKEG